MSHTNDSASGRTGTAQGKSSFVFEGGPCDGQIWMMVDCHDHGPTQDKACIVIRDDCDEGWPLYESDPGTFGEQTVRMRFKGWD